MAFGKGVNYFPSLSKHGRPASISQVPCCVILSSACRPVIHKWKLNHTILAGSCPLHRPLPHLCFITKSGTVQGSQTQRNVRSSMSDPDMFLNYTPTHTAGSARYSFPEGVHVPEGSAAPLSFGNMAPHTLQKLHVFTDARKLRCMV